MFGLKIFARVQTFRRVPPVLPRNFCQPVLLIMVLVVMNYGVDDADVVDSYCGDEADVADVGVADVK